MSEPMRRRPVAWSLFATLLIGTLRTGLAMAQPTGVTIDALVRDLGDARYQVRHAAEESLRKQRSSAMPALLKANEQGESAEQRKAVQRLLAVLAWPTDKETARTQLARLDRFVKDREVDRLIEALIYWRDFHGKEQQRHVLAVVEELATFAERESGLDRKSIRLTSVPKAADLRREIRTPIISNIDVSTLGYVEAFSGSDSLNAAIVARETYRPSRQIYFGLSVLLLNNDLVSLKRANLHGSLIFVNGDFKNCGPLSAWSSIIVCNGDITVPGDGSEFGFHKSIVIATGEIKPGRVGFHWCEEYKALARHNKFLEEFKIYDLSRVGAEAATEANGGARLKAVREGHVFAKAGLQKEDVVLAVNGTPVDSPRALARLLSRVSITGVEGFLTVRRQGRTLYIPVSITD